MEVLRSGGNAIDAAVAASAMLGVIEPHCTGIGGDCFAFAWVAKEQKLYAINGSGHAPAGLSAQWLKDQGFTNIPGDSVYSVTVPGSVRAWDMLLKDYGTKSLREMLQPAIAAAEVGFPVAERVAWDWRMFAHKLTAHQATREQYMVELGAPRTGMVVR